MKKNFILLMTIAACVMASCSGNNDTYEVGETRILVNTDLVQFVEVAGTKTVEVMTPMPWTVRTNATWCTASVKNQQQLEISVAAKGAPEDPDRIAIVTIKTSDGIIKNLPVKQGTSKISLLVGEWLVTEDFNDFEGWQNDQQYTITMRADETDPTKVIIEGFAPYMYDEGHTIYAYVFGGITIPSQELLPGWDEPDYKTYIAALKTGTFAVNAGADFPELPITTNADGKLQINLLGGFGGYSYQVYDLYADDLSYAGPWAYTYGTKWVKID